MSRSLSIFALLLLAAVSFGLYRLSYEVQRREDELVELNRALLQERETIGVLQAEWSYVTRPEYLQDKAQRLLEMRPATAKDIVTLDSLPWRQDRTAPDKASPGKAEPTLPPMASAPQASTPVASAPAADATAAVTPVRVAARPADAVAAPNLDAEAAAVLGAMQRSLAQPAGKANAERAQ